MMLFWSLKFQSLENSQIKTTCLTMAVFMAVLVVLAATGELSVSFFMIEEPGCSIGFFI